MPFSKDVDNDEDSPPLWGIRGRPARIWAGAEAVAEVSAGPHRNGRVWAKRAETWTEVVTWDTLLV